MHGYKDTPMGKAMKVAIMVMSPEKEEDMKKMPKGKKPKDAPKLPEGWHYMPDGTVMADSEHESEEYSEEEEYTED